MKAVVYNKKGSPEKLIYCNIEKPVPKDNEVLIRVFAVSVNAADYRSMKMGIIPEKKIFGADIAGRIESVGKNTRQFMPGDEVMGELGSYGFGGFAEYVAVPEEALILKPPKLSFEESAALPMAALTAYQALRKGRIQHGHKVLIAGSSGGVGTFAIQLAKHSGAIVTGVCSSDNVEQTKILGADFVIDYTKEDFAATTAKYDLILAIHGNQSLLTYKKILSPNGTCVMVGGSLKQIFRFLIFGWSMSLGSKKMKFLAAKPHKNDLELLAKLMEDGKIKPVIDKIYKLENTADAMRYASTGHARGKVVIKVNPD
jgi:NADPH:quinone reductase-like Zn-dependent oxidoreductase